MTDLSMVRGDAPVIDLAIKQDDGSPYPLTGSTLYMTAKYDPNDADSRAVFQKSSPSNGISITNGAGGLAQVALAPGDTAGVSCPVDLYYDVQVVKNNDVQTPLSGKLTVSADVTRRSA